MPAPRKDTPYNALSALALVGQVGLMVAIPVLLGVVVGNYLDRLAGGRGLVLVGMILAGLAAGLYGAFRLLLRETPWKR